jgi:hypothetical protein
MLDILELLDTVGSDASLRYLDAHAMSTHFATAGALTLSKAMVSDDPRAIVSADFGGEGNREPNHINGVFVEYMEAEMTTDIKSAQYVRSALVAEFGGEGNYQPNLGNIVFFEHIEEGFASDLKSVGSLS